MATVDVFGLGVESLLRGDTLIQLSEAFGNADVVGLYFSAHWCAPCRSTTPILCKIYNDLLAAGKQIEIVFISSDRDEEHFRSYYKEMPWLALPYEARDQKKALSEQYDCQGIPYLVLLDGKTGKEITREGRSVITTGVLGFPFTEAALANAEAAKSAKLLQVFSDWKVLGSEVDASALQSKEAVAVFVGSANGDAKYVLPALAEAYATLAARLAVVYIRHYEAIDTEAETAFQAAMPASWTKLQNPTAIAAALAALREPTGDLDNPTLFVVSGDGQTLFSEDACRVVYRNKADGFPWSTAALALATKEKQDKVDAFKELLTGGGLRFLADATLVTAGNVKLPGSAPAHLQEFDLVGLYFSAHWCPPCLKFTPKVKIEYNKLKAAGKKAEVVFVSSDRNAESFASYFADMPWLALDYDQRDLKQMLSSAFGVEGIPTLLWINPRTGEVLLNGDETILYGADFFPWTPDQMALGKAQQEAKEAQAKLDEAEAEARCLQSFRDAKTVVVKNHRGKGTLQADYTLTFGNFNTFSADVQLAQGKFYYEIEIVAMESIAQIGWYTEGFAVSEHSEGQGVGDDAFSWGFDGVRQQKWGNGGDSTFGSKWKVGDVLGCAVDLSSEDAHTMSFSVNGSFAAPDGVAFESFTAAWVAPALTSSGGVYKVNFGDRPLQFSAPDATYQSVHAFYSAQS